MLLRLFTDTFSIFFAVLGLELRAFTLSHSTSPIFVRDFFFEVASHKLFARVSRDPPDLCLLCS
jgi:hypothetical protein